MRESILQGFPHAEIAVSIVWVHMLQGDSGATAEEAARLLDDPRVRHFHDPGRRSGAAIADGLAWEDQTAWDIYLFYDGASRWAEKPPAPADFMHQLSWEPTRFRTGDDLVNGLRQAMKRILEKATG